MRRTPSCTCGAAYADFRTGLRFGEVRRMLYTGDTDPATWRNKRRGGVLGYWRELKIMMYETLHGARDAI